MRVLLDTGINTRTTLNLFYILKQYTFSKKLSDPNIFLPIMIHHNK